MNTINTNILVTSAKTWRNLHLDLKYEIFMKAKILF